MLVGMMLLNMDTMYHAHRDGMLSDEIWNRELGSLQRILEAPGSRVLWKQVNITESFRQHVEETLLAGSATG